MIGGMTEVYRKLTVNLTKRASDSLDLGAELNSDTKTDTVNRALQVYAYVCHVVDRGDEVLIRDHVTGDISKVKFL